MSGHTPDQKSKEKTRLSGPKEEVAPAAPRIPDHQLLRCIGQGRYGEVWLTRKVIARRLIRN